MARRSGTNSSKACYEHVKILGIKSTAEKEKEKEVIVQARAGYGVFS